MLHSDPPPQPPLPSLQEGHAELEAWYRDYHPNSNPTTRTQPPPRRQPGDPGGQPQRPTTAPGVWYGCGPPGDAATLLEGARKPMTPPLGHAPAFQGLHYEVHQATHPAPCAAPLAPSPAPHPLQDGGAGPLPVFTEPPDGPARSNVRLLEPLASKPALDVQIPPEPLASGAEPVAVDGDASAPRRTSGLASPARGSLGPGSPARGSLAPSRRQSSTLTRHGSQVSLKHTSFSPMASGTVPVPPSPSTAAQHQAPSPTIQIGSLI